MVYQMARLGLTHVVQRLLRTVRGRSGQRGPRRLARRAQLALVHARPRAHVHLHTLYTVYTRTLRALTVHYAQTYLGQRVERLLVHVLEPAHEGRVGQQLGVVAVRAGLVRRLVAEVDQRVVQVPRQRRR